MRSWALLLLLSSCGALETHPEELRQLIAELQPAVVQELGANHASTWDLLLVPDLPSRMATVRVGGVPSYFGYRSDWQAMSASAQRFVVAHELVHLYGPRLHSYALTEGLADVVACRLAPDVMPGVWAEHWRALALSDCTVNALLKQTPASDREDDTLRALGYLTVFVLPPEQLQQLCDGDLTARQVLDMRSWTTVLELLQQAAAMRPTYSAPLEPVETDSGMMEE